MVPVALVGHGFVSFGVRVEVQRVGIIACEEGDFTVLIGRVVYGLGSESGLNWLLLYKVIIT